MFSFIYLYIYFSYVYLPFITLYAIEGGVFTQVLP